MNDRLRESVSALMDDAGDDLEMRRLLAAMETDGELRGKWHRYHVISAVMRRERMTALGVGGLGVAEGAAAAVAAQQPEAMPVRAAPLLRRHATRVAVAALAAVGVTVMLGGRDDMTSSPTIASVAPSAQVTQSILPAAQELAESHNREKMLRHARMAFPQGQPLPFVKTVVFAQ